MKLTLESPATSISGVGAKLAKILQKLEIRGVRDLLFYFPYRYLDFSQFTNIVDAKPGEIVTVRGTIKTIVARFSFKSRVSLCEAIVSDSTGSMKVMWFNQPYLAKSLTTGDEVYLSGRVEQYKGIQLTNPIHEKLSEEMIHTGRLVPVYHITEGIYHRTFRTMIKEVLPLAIDLEDTMPMLLQQEYNLLPLPEAIAQLHFPESTELLERAKFRIIFEEVLTEQLAIQRHKQLLAESPAPSIAPDVELTKSFLATLPFELTDSQRKAAWQIMQDMEIKHPMNRLLQGDVGSGKTLVALLAALQAIHAGYQAALIVPTEVLARQHYESISSYLKKFSKNYHVGLLTSFFQMRDGKLTTKELLAKSLTTNKINILVGTHAILQKGVQFFKLGLVIIDEQHRFGVEQRSFLLKEAKSFQKDTDYVPHLLSMSATPIPRTLALSLYGDLEVSALTEMPKGRQKIITTIIPEIKRGAAYSFIAEQITTGRQAFIITPRVEETDASEIKSVKKEYERLSKEIFKKFRVGLLYGSMKGKDKEAVMQRFNSGELDILVATSVIEIGIDVPNATVMLIEGAQTFGLAQLHQLRGRVGRGSHQSYCLLFTDSDAPQTLERLTLFSNSHDGFKLAEYDLKQRGFGSLFGTQQTGFNFRFSQFLNFKVLQKAKEGAQLLLKTDPKLKKYAHLKKQSDPALKKIHLE